MSETLMTLYMMRRMINSARVLDRGAWVVARGELIYRVLSVVKGTGRSQKPHTRTEIIRRSLAGAVVDSHSGLVLLGIV